MKPVLIFEHIETSNAGLFEVFLKKNTIPYLVLRPNKGDAVPACDRISDYSGLCFLGGTESVTESTEQMLREMDLIRAASAEDTPVIGHCLGGQLISKALGGEVTKHHLNEFGWSQLYSEENAISREWIPEMATGLHAMQWNSDTFSTPQGATKILSGDYCSEQAFVYENMLAMQFHIEIELDMIEHWSIDLYEKHPVASNSVQSGEQIMNLRECNFQISRRLANHLYEKWATFLK